MRFLLFLIAFLFNATLLLAQSTLYNWQKNGLRLRDQPSASGRIITKIPYGARLEVLEVIKDKPFSAKLFSTKRVCEQEEGVEIKNHELNGNWIKVKYNDSIAYVANVYLSPLKTIPLQAKDDGAVMYDNEKMQRILFSYFGMPLKRSKKNTAKEKGEEAYIENFAFVNNVTVKHELQYLEEGAGGEVYEISISKRNVMDVLWLAFVLAQNGEVDEANYCYVETDTNVLKLDHYGEGQSNTIEIKQEKDKVILSLSFGGC
ncbi:SH3 domain-containing protein [Solitalea canadensis]|nr:SH3 domain-containing protein [Solitalea canadensis]